MKAKSKTSSASRSQKESRQPSQSMGGSGYGIMESQLSKLFEDQLRDIYWAEKALTNALTKMAKKATSRDLVDVIENHLEETRAQITKLDSVFESIGKKPRGKKCEAMEGLIKEGEEIISETEEGAMRDAGIIAAAQKVEHYEIATYGTLRTYAQLLGVEEAANILEEILDEEKAADVKLTEVASEINLQAIEDAEEEEEE